MKRETIVIEEYITPGFKILKYDMYALEGMNNDDGNEFNKEW